MGWVLEWNWRVFQNQLQDERYFMHMEKSSILLFLAHQTRNESQKISFITLNHRMPCDHSNKNTGKGDRMFPKWWGRAGKLLWRVKCNIIISMWSETLSLSNHWNSWRSELYFAEHLVTPRESGSDTVHVKRDTDDNFNETRTFRKIRKKMKTTTLLLRNSLCQYYLYQKLIGRMV